MITQLSDLLRLTLRASRAHEIPLAEELQITRLYLDLMQKRFEEKLRVNYAIDAALNDSLVPQLILQPLLENSLRHGMKPSGEAMDIRIAAHRDNGSLILQVSDTGTGLGSSDPSVVFGRGVGLSNIRDRLLQLYGDAQEFRVANAAAGGAEVTMRVPYRTAPQSRFGGEMSESSFSGDEASPAGRDTAAPLHPR
jgi:LytS/YehU family sensor histidine kinase